MSRSRRSKHKQDKRLFIKDILLKRKLVWSLPDCSAGSGAKSGGTDESACTRSCGGRFHRGSCGWSGRRRLACIAAPPLRTKAFGRVRASAIKAAVARLHPPAPGNRAAPANRARHQVRRVARARVDLELQQAVVALPVSSVHREKIQPMEQTVCAESR